MVRQVASLLFSANLVLLQMRSGAISEEAGNLSLSLLLLLAAVNSACCTALHSSSALHWFLSRTESPRMLPFLPSVPRCQSEKEAYGT